MDLYVIFQELHKHSIKKTDKGLQNHFVEGNVQYVCAVMGLSDLVILK